MAPVGEAYFPPLDRCLGGAEQLWSWELCFNILTRIDEIEHDSLRRFLSDPQTQDILLHPLSPYSKPSPQTKSTFDTKTSAINVSQSSHASYSIQQIKNDALWLSKENGIDEVSSLRITILEWQKMAASGLLGPGPSGDTPDKLGVSRGSLTVSNGNSILPYDIVQMNRDESEDGEEVKRRKRLAEILLSERRHILKCSEYIFARPLRSQGEDENCEECHRLQWLSEIGRGLSLQWTAHAKTKGKHASQRPGFLPEAIEAIRTRLSSLGTGSGWSGYGTQHENVEINWGMNQAIEVVHILEIIYDILQKGTVLPQSEVILSWFRLMAECAFLEEFRLPYPGLETAYSLPLQSLTSIISLSFFDITTTLQLLAQPSTMSTGAPSSTSPLPYILNPAATNELNDILIHAAPLTTASPCIMAWSVITQAVRDVVMTTRDSRETRQSNRAIDKFGAGDASDSDGYERPVTRGMFALRRRSSASSDTSQQPTLIEEVYESISQTIVEDDPIAYLAKNAAEGGKFLEVIAAIATQYCSPYGFEHDGGRDKKMRVSLLDLIRACVEFVDYQPALVMATMAVVTGSNRYWDLADKPTLRHMTGPATLLRQDDILKRRVFLNALTRFPYESMPLLQLCRALAYEDSANDQGSEIWLSLQELDTFTCMLPPDYQGYQNIREDEELDFIELTEDFFFDTPPHSDKHNAPQPLFKIPRGTHGQVLSSSKPLVVAWNLDYSGLSYIGRLLERASTAQISKELPHSPITSDVVSEAIGFLAVLLLSAFKTNVTQSDKASNQESATSILGQASNDMDRNDDIVIVIFQIFENELYKQREGAEEEETLSVLVECIRFTHALLPFMPDRVWPFLGRSGLLAISEDGGRLSAIISHEIVSGRYDFLLGCIRLYDALIEDAVQNAVFRKTPSKAVARFGAATGFGAGVSQTTMEKVFVSLQRTMIDVFDSFSDWKFVNTCDQSEIGSWLCNIFNKLIEYSYSTITKSSTKLTGSLSPATSIIMDVFLFQAQINLSLEPVIRMCTYGITHASSSVPNRTEQYLMKQTVSALQFISTLTETCIFLGKESSYLQSFLFKNIAIFAKLYAVRPEYKLPVVKIVNALVRSPSSGGQQPPSLLAHLGQHRASQFFDLLSALDKPLHDNSLSIAIWKLLGSILATRQQWFAHLILTGNTPSHQVKKDPEIAMTQKFRPMFALALDQLSDMGRLHPARALAMLEFVTSAVDFWPHMLQTIHDHPRFLLRISEHATSIELKRGARDSATSGDLDACRIFSYSANILAMYAHWTQQEGNPKFAEETLKHLHLLARTVTLTPSYNVSLHSRLRRNFADRFPGCDLTDFQRSNLRPTSTGDSFFYDLDLANKMLSFEPAWRGRRGQGFADELKRANFNISLVDAQVSLFHSWKSLLSELSATLAKAPKFQNIIAQTVVQCLRANAENDLPESFFQRLVMSRADLAFTLLETLNLAKSTEPGAQDILRIAWNTLRGHDDNLGAALGAEDADYHRLLIRILYLATQLHTLREPPLNAQESRKTTTSPPKAARFAVLEASVRIALEIISALVSRGFRSLTGLLHESPSVVTPSDFSILTALLNTCLQIPGVSRNTEHLVSAFTDTATPRCAASLLSWSDQLAAATNGDPIYGEVSMLFLLELSIVPAIAESLAVEAVLSHILTTNLMQAMQDRAFSPFDNPPRMYSIWARGLLPLLLNLLHAVGPSIAAEVAAALNTFPAQLSRASQAFGSSSPRNTTSTSKNHITLSTAQEAHCLALIVSILRTFREAGASAGIAPGEVEDIKWDANQVKDDIEGWLQRRGALREGIVPNNAKEEGWAEMKASKEGMGESRLEEKVVSELKGVLVVLEAREV